MEILAVGLEVKFASDGAVGSFEGYGSVADVIDDHNDRVAQGAFASSLSGWKTRGFMPPMYFQHGPMLGGPAEPVGVWDDMLEDSKGLHVKGRMLGLETDIGRYRYELVKGGAMRGLSIGYRTEKADFKKEGDKTIRTLKQVKLREVSIVDDPANAYARVDAIKSAAQFGAPADDADVMAAIKAAESFSTIERFLREAKRALSRSEAAALVSQIKTIAQSESESKAEMKAIAVKLQSNIAILKPAR